MPKIKELRQRLADVKAEGRRKIAEAEALEAKAERTDDEQTKLDGLNAEIERLEGDVAEAQVAVEAEERRLDRQRAFAAPERQAADDERAPALSRQVTDPNPEQTWGFQNLAEFAVAVQRATPGGGNVVRHDERLAGFQAAPTNYHQESGGTDGYMVPPEFRRSIWELVFSTDEGEDLIDLVDMEPTMSNQVQLTADESTPWGSSGVQANWRSEGSQMTPSQLSTEGRNVRLHELYAFVLATEELRQDAPRLQDRLTRQAARAIRWKASDAIMHGTGAGQPQGFFTANCLVTVAKESGQSADTLDDQNVLKMFARWLMAGGARGRWVTNPDTIPQLAGMTIGDQPVWLAPNGLVGGPGGILLGRPVMLSEHAKTLGDKGDLSLFNPAGYYATNKAGGNGGIDFASSIHLYFDYAIEAFRWMFRFGGQPYLSAAVSPANGSSTKSHFVTLAERA